MSKRRAMAFVILILLVASVFRLPRLTDFPPGLHYDEAANAILSGDIGLRGDRPVFIESYTGKEVLYFYGAGSLMAVLGESIFALRLASAFFGLLTVAVTYRLGILFSGDRRLGLLAALFLALFFQHILFSRLGFRAITQPLLQGLTVWFLVEGLVRWSHTPSRGRFPYWGWFVLSGITLGLTAYTYLAARLFPIAIVIGFAPVVFQLLWQRESRWKTVWGSGLTLLAGLIVLTPLLLYFLNQPDAFWVRISQVGAAQSAPITISEGLRRVVLMLFWPGEGDPYIRFNLPGRALFSLLWLPFALIGLIVLIQAQFSNKTQSNSNRFILHPSSFILLITPLVMLLPSALATSEIVPSNLRAIGILPFLIFWPAIGLLTIWDQLLKGGKEAKPEIAYLPFLLAVILFVQGGMTASAYFQRWGSQSSLFYENDGDILSMANEIEPREGERVFVSTRFTPHPTLAFGTENYDALTLLPRSETLVFPNLDDGPFYPIYFPTGSPKAEWMTSFLGDPIEQNENFERYRINSQIELFPSVPVATQFGFAVQMLGYDVDPYEPGDEQVGIRLYWEVLGSPGFEMTPFVHLEDGRGGRWGQREQVGFAAADWRAGDRFVQDVEVPIAVGAPPGFDYQLRVGWFDPATGDGVARFSLGGQFAGTAYVIEGIEIGPSAPPDPLPSPPELLDVDVRPGLALLGYEKGKRTLSQGEPLWVSLWWVADRPLPEMSLRFELRQGRDGVILRNTQPVYNRYPFERWSDPLFLVDHHAPEIPIGQEAGQYEIHIRVLAADNSTLYTTSLGEVTVTESDILFSPPDVDRPADALFGGEIGLYGYSLRPADGSEGNRYTLDLTWRAESRPAAAYTTFVHLLDLDGTCCLWQEDRLIGDSGRPSSVWLSGEYVTDRFEIELPETVEEQGRYPLEIGLYLPESGQRLSVDSPLPGGEDYIFLTPLEAP